MQAIWRRTAVIVWQCPGLWLPVIFADAIVFFLKWIQRVTTHWVVMWLAETHSELGVQYPVNGRWFTPRALLLLVPITWGTFFLSILICAVALLIIHRFLIANMETGCPTVPAWRDAPPRSYLSVLWFCFKILALYAMSAILVAAFALLLPAVHHGEILQRPLFLYGSTALVAMGIAYCKSPAAVTFLRASASGPLTTVEASRARISAALAVLASLAVSILLQHAGQSLVANRSTSTSMLRGFELFSSLLSAIPYIPFFIALSLIAAHKDSQTIASPSPETALDSC